MNLFVTSPLSRKGVCDNAVDIFLYTDRGILIVDDDIRTCTGRLERISAQIPIEFFFGIESDCFIFIAFHVSECPWFRSEVFSVEISDIFSEPHEEYAVANALGKIGVPDGEDFSFVLIECDVFLRCPILDFFAERYKICIGVFRISS